jgi:hypothetical protein
LLATLWLTLWFGGLALALAAGLRLRARLRAHVDRRPVLVDDDIRRIVETGVYVSDEDPPLDLDRVREEERRFWEEAEWDEAQE